MMVNENTSVPRWDEFDPGSVEVLKAWEEHMTKNNLHHDSEYNEIISEITEEFGDNGIVQLYLTYEEVLEEICGLHQKELPFSETLVEEIAETILQKLMHGEIVDYVELIPVSDYFETISKCFSENSNTKFSVFQYLNAHIIADINEYAKIGAKADEFVADSDYFEIQRIKRKYFGLVGGGKLRFGKLQNSMEKLQQQKEELKNADSNGSTYESISYALNSILGKPTDPSIRKFQRKPKSAKKKDRDLSKSITELKKKDAKTAFKLRWEGTGWSEMVNPDTKQKHRLILSWKVTVLLFRISKITATF